MRRVARAGLTDNLRRKRVKLGAKIIQWRKSEGKTVATAGTAAAVIARLQSELLAAHRRIEELEENLAAHLEEGGSSGRDEESSDSESSGRDGQSSDSESDPAPVEEEDEEGDGDVAMAEPEGEVASRVEPEGDVVGGRSVQCVWREGYLEILD